MARPVDVLAPARLGADFRKLLGAALLTNLGDGMAIAAGPLLVASQTRDPMLVALAVILQRIPWLLVGLYAGVLADRVDRRAILVSANLARVAVLAVLAVAVTTERADIVVVLASLFALGLAETFEDVTAATVTPMLVAAADLGVANARLQSAFITANQLAGPPLGAFLFAAGHFLPFAGQAVLVAFGAVLVSRIRRSTVPADPTADSNGSPRRSIRRDVTDGVRWLWRNPPVRTLALTIVTFNVTFGAAWSVLVLYADDRLGLGEVGYGLLTTTSAIGGLCGTAMYARLERRFALATIMRAGLVIETLTHLALALITRGELAMAVMFVFGAHAFIWSTTSSTVRQRAVPTAFQGRVGSVYLLGVVGGMVVGGAIGGLIARQTGITGPFWFGFVGSALILVAIWRELAHIAHSGAPPEAPPATDPAPTSAPTSIESPDGDR